MDSSTLKHCAKGLGIFVALLFCAAASPRAESFGGIGLQVVPVSSGELVVLRVIKSGPAAAEDFRPGDLILSVGEFPLAGSDFTEVVTKYLWGASGTSVALTYMRPGEDGVRSATVQRVPMEPQTIDTPGVQTLAPQ
jgi:C-terminal processing protease CtpA/Prc